MAKVDPLNETEEAFWRALMRISLSLPRRLDSDLVRTVGITANEYTTLMCLSEAPGRELRMADLANAAALSASRMTRLVDDLQARGLVAKRGSSEDGRGNVAMLTPAGLAKIKKAWPAHLASVLKNAIDFLYAEWNNKAVGVVSYGAVGGARAAEHLRLIAGELQMADVRTNVALSMFTDFENFAELTPGPHQAQALDTLLGEVVRWSEALAPLREAAHAAQPG